MTEYNELVEYQKVKLEAETWAKGIKALHAHSLSSMWYDDRPQDTDNGTVMDISYNDGRVKRTIIKTGEVIWMNGNSQVTGEELVYEYTRHNPTQ